MLLRLDPHGPEENKRKFPRAVKVAASADDIALVDSNSLNGKNWQSGQRREEAKGDTLWHSAS
jgi:hypothetical protein